MPAKKRTYEKVFDFVYLILYEQKGIRQAGKDLGFSPSVANYALKDAVTFGFITKKEFDKIHYNSYTKGHQEIVKRLGEDRWKDYYATMGIKSAASNGIEKLVENAIKGGNTTQKNHARKVKRNLRNAKQYGATSCRYNGYNFDSQGERMTGLLLRSYGLLEDLIPGVNFQKQFGRLTADFYIPQKNLIVEYHPIPKQRFENINEEMPTSIEQYTNDRKEKMKYYFDGEMVVISPQGQWSAKEFFIKMKDIGIEEEWPEFLKRCRSIRKDISLSDKQYELEMNSIPEEDDCPF